MTTDLPWDLGRPTFPSAPVLREGYVRDEVDGFVYELRHALRQDPPTMAPYEVLDARFHVTRRRGYAMREVDGYLARAAELLKERHGADAVAGIEGHLTRPRHVSTGWVYAVAAVLVIAIVAVSAYLLTR